MTKQLTIRIFPDGRVQADLQGIKGKKCTDYIRLLEEILEAEAVDSTYTPEFYESEEVVLDETQKQNIKRE